MRYFVAIDLPQVLKNELKRIQSEWHKCSLFSGKFVESGNLHLTLRFLGELGQDTVASIQKDLSSLKFKSFEMRLGKLGVFVPDNPRVLWVDLIGKEIYQLQNQIEILVQKFIEPELRPFVSHVTLARIKQVYNRHALLNKLNEIKVKPLSFAVDKFVLKQSELTRNGPIYTTVACYP